MDLCKRSNGSIRAFFATARKPGNSSSDPRTLPTTAKMKSVFARGVATFICHIRRGRSRGRSLRQI